MGLEQRTRQGTEKSSGCIVCWSKPNAGLHIASSNERHVNGFVLKELRSLRENRTMFSHHIQVCKTHTVL